MRTRELDESDLKNVIMVGKYVKTQYGAGKVLAITNEWLIHNRELENSNQTVEFAISLLIDDNITNMELVCKDKKSFEKII